MPYIKQEDRKGWLIPIADSPGTLNYFFTCAAIAYVNEKGKSYTTLSEALSAFEAAKLEFYRRAVVPYENKKIEENGDVYDKLS